MISEQDKKAWQAAIQDVKPISDSNRVVNTAKDTSISIQDPVELIKEPPDKMPIIVDRTGDGPIEKKMSKTLRTGGYTSHGSFDYHGDPVDMAFTKFMKDIKISYSKNGEHRNLIIITGKSGVMKNEFKQWCQHKAVRKFIWYVCPAHPKDGGDGAWYVILRRNSK